MYTHHQIGAAPRSEVPGQGPKDMLEIPRLTNQQSKQEKNEPQQNGPSEKDANSNNKERKIEESGISDLGAPQKEIHISLISDSKNKSNQNSKVRERNNRGQDIRIDSLDEDRHSEENQEQDLLTNLQSQGLLVNRDTEYQQQEGNQQITTNLKISTDELKIRGSDPDFRRQLETQPLILQSLPDTSPAESAKTQLQIKQNRIGSHKRGQADQNSRGLTPPQVTRLDLKKVTSLGSNVEEEQRIKQLEKMALKLVRGKDNESVGLSRISGSRFGDAANWQEQQYESMTRNLKVIVKCWERIVRIQIKASNQMKNLKEKDDKIKMIDKHAFLIIFEDLSIFIKSKNNQSSCQTSNLSQLTVSTRRYERTIQDQKKLMNDIWQGLFGFYFQNLMAKIREEESESQTDANQNGRFSSHKQYMPSQTFYNILKVLFIKNHSANTSVQQTKSQKLFLLHQEMCRYHIKELQDYVNSGEASLKEKQVFVKARQYTSLMTIEHIQQTVVDKLAHILEDNFDLESKLNRIANRIKESKRADSAASSNSNMNSINRRNQSLAVASKAVKRDLSSRTQQFSEQKSEMMEQTKYVALNKNKNNIYNENQVSRDELDYSKHSKFSLPKNETELTNIMIQSSIQQPAVNYQNMRSSFNRLDTSNFSMRQDEQLLINAYAQQQNKLTQNANSPQSKQQFHSRCLTQQYASKEKLNIQNTPLKEEEEIINQNNGPAMKNQGQSQIDQNQLNLQAMQQEKMRVEQAKMQTVPQATSRTAHFEHGGLQKENADQPYTYMPTVETEHADYMAQHQENNYAFKQTKLRAYGEEESVIYQSLSVPNREADQTRTVGPSAKAQAHKNGSKLQPSDDNIHPWQQKTQQNAILAQHKQGSDPVATHQNTALTPLEIQNFSSTSQKNTGMKQQADEMQANHESAEGITGNDEQKTLGELQIKRKVRHVHSPSFQDAMLQQMVPFDDKSANVSNTQLNAQEMATLGVVGGQISQNAQEHFQNGTNQAQYRPQPGQQQEYFKNYMENSGGRHGAGHQPTNTNMKSQGLVHASMQNLEVQEARMLRPEEKIKTLDPTSDPAAGPDPQIIPTQEVFAKQRRSPQVQQRSQRLESNNQGPISEEQELLRLTQKLSSNNEQATKEIQQVENQTSESQKISSQKRQQDLVGDLQQQQTLAKSHRKPELVHSSNRYNRIHEKQTPSQRAAPPKEQQLDLPESGTRSPDGNMNIQLTEDEMKNYQSVNKEYSSKEQKYKSNRSRHTRNQLSQANSIFKLDLQGQLDLRQSTTNQNKAQYEQLDLSTFQIQHDLEIFGETEPQSKGNQSARLNRSSAEDFDFDGFKSLMIQYIDNMKEQKKKKQKKNRYEFGKNEKDFVMKKMINYLRMVNDEETNVGFKPSDQALKNLQAAQKKDGTRQKPKKLGEMRAANANGLGDESSNKPLTTKTKPERQSQQHQTDDSLKGDLQMQSETPTSRQQFKKAPQDLQNSLNVISNIQYSKDHANNFSNDTTSLAEVLKQMPDDNHMQRSPKNGQSQRPKKRRKKSFSKFQDTGTFLIERVDNQKDCIKTTQTNQSPTNQNKNIITPVESSLNLQDQPIYKTTMNMPSDQQAVMQQQLYHTFNQKECSQVAQISSKSQKQKQRSAKKNLQKKEAHNNQQAQKQPKPLVEKSPMEKSIDIENQANLFQKIRNSMNKTSFQQKRMSTSPTDQNQVAQLQSEVKHLQDQLLVAQLHLKQANRSVLVPALNLNQQTKSQQHSFSGYNRGFQSHHIDGHQNFKLRESAPQDHGQADMRHSAPNYHTQSASPHQRLRNIQPKMARQVRDGDMIGGGTDEQSEVQSVKYKQISAGKGSQLSRSQSVYDEDHRSQTSRNSLLRLNIHKIVNANRVRRRHDRNRKYLYDVHSYTSIKKQYGSVANAMLLPNQQTVSSMLKRKDIIQQEVTRRSTSRMRHTQLKSFQNNVPAFLNSERKSFNNQSKLDDIFYDGRNTERERGRNESLLAYQAEPNYQQIASQISQIQEVRNKKQTNSQLLELTKQKKMKQPGKVLHQKDFKIDISKKALNEYKTFSQMQDAVQDSNRSHRKINKINQQVDKSSQSPINNKINPENDLQLSRRERLIVNSKHYSKLQRRFSPKKRKQLGKQNGGKQRLQRIFSPLDASTTTQLNVEDEKPSFMSQKKLNQTSIMEPNHFNYSMLSCGSKVNQQMKTLKMVDPGVGDDPQSCLQTYNFACNSSDDDELANIRSAGEEDDNDNESRSNNGQEQDGRNRSLRQVKRLILGWFNSGRESSRERRKSKGSQNTTITRLKDQAEGL